jgi:hypothetical protein
MTLHQINGDGAGPYTCDVNADGTGQTFQAMQVTQNVPGRRGNSNAEATDFQLVARKLIDLVYLCFGVDFSSQRCPLERHAQVAPTVMPALSAAGMLLLPDLSEAAWQVSEGESI